MSATMSSNVRKYNAGDKAAPSLGPRDYSSTLDVMAEQKSSQARQPGGGLAGPWSWNGRIATLREFRTAATGTRAARAQRSREDHFSEQLSPRRRRTCHVAAKGGG